MLEHASKKQNSASRRSKIKDSLNSGEPSVDTVPLTPSFSSVHTVINPLDVSTHAHYVCNFCHTQLFA